MVTSSVLLTGVSGFFWGCFHHEVSSEQALLSWLGEDLTGVWNLRWGGSYSCASFSLLIPRALIRNHFQGTLGSDSGKD